jgi:hypothetical protein
MSVQTCRRAHPSARVLLLSLPSVGTAFPIEPVVVTATRSERKLAEVPASVSVVSAHLSGSIRRFGLHTLSVSVGGALAREVIA